MDLPAERQWQPLTLILGPSPWEGEGGKTCGEPQWAQTSSEPKMRHTPTPRTAALCFAISAWQYPMANGSRYLAQMQAGSQHFCTSWTASTSRIPAVSKLLAWN